jgi:simple sugar transport system ATP-binding protein
MRELQAAGVTFLFISHHLQEVYEICEDVTVLRDARHIVTAPVAEMPRNRLIEAMTGEAASLRTDSAAPQRTGDESAVVLEIDDLSGDDFARVSFVVRRGEVVGISGATSSGRIGVAEAVAGLGRYRGGAIRVNGRTLPPADVPAALALGVGCVPKSRHKQGLVLQQSVADNVTMTASRHLGPLGFVAPGRKRALTQRTIGALGVVTQGPGQLVSALSGGNQQKVVFGRALATAPDVLVLMDPTAGVDVKSKEALLAVVGRMREEGKAILVVSSEIEDLRTCDRVLVMRHGAVVAEYPAGWTDAALVASIEGI